ncbi:MAG: TIGR02266 family protein [Myxococcota bacterium]
MVVVPDLAAGASARAHVRHPFALRVAYTDRKSYLGDWTENLSSGGLFVRTELPLRVGSTTSLELSFPGLLAAVVIEGIVAWRRPASPGVPAGVGVRVEEATSRQTLADLALWATDAAPRIRGQTVEILVTDDNPLAVRFYERALARLGALGGDQLHVAVTLDGHQALCHLETHRVDLLITDLYMPVLDGLTLIKRIRDNPALAPLPILVITSGGADERELCAFAGVNAYLEKPVQIGQILSTILCLQRARAAASGAAPNEEARSDP